MKAKVDTRPDERLWGIVIVNSVHFFYKKLAKSFSPGAL